MWWQFSLHDYFYLIYFVRGGSIYHDFNHELVSLLIYDKFEVFRLSSKFRRLCVSSLDGILLPRSQDLSNMFDVLVFSSSKFILKKNICTKKLQNRMIHEIMNIRSLPIMFPWQLSCRVIDYFVRSSSSRLVYCTWSSDHIFSISQWTSWCQKNDSW